MWNRSVTSAHRASSGLAEELGVTTDPGLMIRQRVNLTPTNASTLGCANRIFCLGVTQGCVCSAGLKQGCRGTAVSRLGTAFENMCTRGIETSNSNKTEEHGLGRRELRVAKTQHS